MNHRLPHGCEDLKFLIMKKLSIVWVHLILIQRFLKYEVRENFIPFVLINDVLDVK